MSLSLAQKVRRLTWSKEKKTLVENGILDENGVHTPEGRNLLWVILFEEYEAQLVEKIAEAKAAYDTDDKKKSAKS